MLKKIVFTVSFILLSLYGFAQKNINNYKYVLVPKSYDFTKGEDRYQLNSITKFLFNKYGFEAYFIGDDYPEELINNKCLALRANVVDAKGGLLKTKLEISLEDCFGDIVMTSKVGDSKFKNYSSAYNEALRKAFDSFKFMNYNYAPLKENGVVEQVKQKKEGEKELTISNIKALDGTKDEVNKKTANTENKKTLIKKTEKPSDGDIELYYAQAISNGYQIVDSEPKIVMVLLKSGAKDVYIVKGENAIVFKEDGIWYYSENNADSSTKKRLNIKF